MITGRPSISLLCRALSPAWCPDTKLLTNGQLKPAGNPRLLSTSTCTTLVPVRGAGEQRRCPTSALAFVWAGFTAMLRSIPVGTGAASAGVHSLSGPALVWRAVSLMMDVSRCQPRIRFSLRQSSFVSQEAPPKHRAASAVTGCVLPIGGLSRRNTTLWDVTITDQDGRPLDGGSLRLQHVDARGGTPSSRRGRRRSAGDLLRPDMPTLGYPCRLSRQLCLGSRRHFVQPTRSHNTAVLQEVEKGQLLVVSMS